MGALGGGLIALFRRGSLRRASSFKNSPDADRHETDAREMVEMFLAYVLRDDAARQHADGGGNDQRERRADKDGLSTHFPVGSEQKRGELGLVSQLGDKDRRKDGQQRLCVHGAPMGEYPLVAGKAPSYFFIFVWRPDLVQETRRQGRPPRSRASIQRSPDRVRASAPNIYSVPPRYSGSTLPIRRRVPAPVP